MQDTISDDLAAKKVGKILIQFQDWMRTTQLKPSTRRVYISRLRQLVAFIEANPTESDDFASVANAYLAFAKQENTLKANTVNNMITMFRLIAKVIDDRAVHFEREASEEQSRSGLTAEEQALYLAAAARGHSSRDLLLALIFLKTNIRLGEAMNIKISDLIWELDGVKVRIDGRSGKRIEILDVTICRAMRNWLSERSELKSAANSEYLFPGQTIGGKITGSSMDTALRKIGWRAGLSVSARLLRNTCTKA
ncbi:MAG: tyrosine-type recombinase/integrase [Candidatus Obscuribacterales bacterium]|nr:tyrosine-type recombinase/integrase [Candidatus Obscuribacterales bacterium]